MYMQRNSVPVKVIPTISDGDCLFAACAMGLEGRSMEYAEQRSAARKFRNATVHFMRTSTEFQELISSFPREEGVIQIGDPRDAYKDEDEQSKVLAIIGNNPIALAVFRKARVGSNANQSFKSMLAAYTTIMAIPGVWARHTEVIAISMMTQRHIIVKIANEVPTQFRVNIRNANVTLVEAGTPSSDPFYIHYNGINHYQALLLPIPMQQNTRLQPQPQPQRPPQLPQPQRPPPGAPGGGSVFDVSEWSAPVYVVASAVSMACSILARLART